MSEKVLKGLKFNKLYYINLWNEYTEEWLTVAYSNKKEQADTICKQLNSNLHKLKKQFKETDLISDIKGLKKYEVSY